MKIIKMKLIKMKIIKIIHKKLKSKDRIVFKIKKTPKIIHLNLFNKTKINHKEAILKFLSQKVN